MGYDIGWSRVEACTVRWTAGMTELKEDAGKSIDMYDHEPRSSIDLLR